MNTLKLEQQLERFINSGLKQSRFTKDLYNMLYIDTNVFIAHFNKEGFYNTRFLIEANRTVELLDLVQKPELRPLCIKLSRAIETRLNVKTEVVRTYSIEA